MKSIVWLVISGIAGLGVVISMIAGLGDTAIRIFGMTLLVSLTVTVYRMVKDRNG